jgi:type I restriction enzyme S subunit
MSAAFATLGSVAEFVNGAAFRPEDWGDEGKPIVRIQNLTDPTKPFNRTKRELAEKLHVHPGDLLVSWSATLGVFEWREPEVALLNQHIFRVLPDETRIEKRYLRYGLESALLDMQRHLHGATMQHVNRGEFLATRLYLPPLPEQRRIAEILDKADALRAKRRAALAQLDTLNQSIFLDMFGDPATNPKGWPQVPIGDHASKIGSGATPRGGDENYKPSGITLIRSMNVRDSAFLRDGLAFIDLEQAAQLEGVIVETDDVLLNITGASVARVCRAPADVLPARVNQHVAIIRPTATFNPAFLEQCLLFPSVKERLLKIARAGATREAITKAAIEQFRVIRPPREVQDQFAFRVDASKKAHLQMCSALGEMDSLFFALQHRAFRGEL